MLRSGVGTALFRFCEAFGVHDHESPDWILACSLCLRVLLMNHESLVFSNSTVALTALLCGRWMKYGCSFADYMALCEVFPQDVMESLRNCFVALQVCMTEERLQLNNRESHPICSVLLANCPWYSVALGINQYCPSLPYLCNIFSF